MIKLASRNGWIRVRHYVRPTDYWSIQCDVIEKRLPVIMNFIKSMIYEFKEMSEYESLILVEFDNKEKQTYGFIDGGAKSLLEKFNSITCLTMQMKTYSDTYMRDMGK